MNVREYLLAAYRAVTQDVRHETRRRFPDQSRLAQLKKERLALKDRIVRYRPTSGSTLAMAADILARAKRAAA